MGWAELFRFLIGWVRLSGISLGYIENTALIHRSNNNHEHRFSYSSERIYILIRVNRFILKVTGTGSLLILVCFIYVKRRDFRGLEVPVPAG